MGDYEYLFLNDFLDTDSKKRYDYLQLLGNNGLRYPIVMCTYSPGNNKGNLHFIWRVPNAEKKLKMSLAVVNQSLSPFNQIFQCFTPELCEKNCTQSLAEIPLL